MTWCIYSSIKNNLIWSEKGEVSFAEECKRLLDLCDEIGNKGDNKYANRESKARLKHKYY